jgi:hypothetical protein
MSNNTAPKPSLVLCFASPIQGGKTTVSRGVAAHLEVPRVSFGDYLRRVARERGLEITRGSLQRLGLLLVTSDARRLCEGVLGQCPCDPGRPFVVDGVRHTEVLDHVREIVAPAPVFLQRVRLENDPLSQGRSLDDLESHPTERQVRTILPERAALVLDGSQDPDDLTKKVIQFCRLHEPNWRS